MWFYLIFKSDDGNWYRALVEDIISDRVVRVHFVDYGNVEEVPVDNIRHISSSFLELPFQGIKCWLSGGSSWILSLKALLLLGARNLLLVEKEMMILYTLQNYAL